jgi:hypothetical protein
MKTQMQKVFAIVNKETKQIVEFGLNAKEVKEIWDDYYVGEEKELTHELQQTFMSQNEIKKEMSLA